MTLNPAETDRTSNPGEDDAGAAARLEAGARLLKTAEPGVMEFYRAFYRDAPPDDLNRYMPETLAGLARLVFERTVTRKHNETLVTLCEFRARCADSVRNELILIAVNDDMPFLFDSLVGEASELGARILALFHPIMTVTRDGAGVRGSKGAHVRESVIVLAIDPVFGEERGRTLVEAARVTFEKVRLAVRDWHKMVTHLKEAIAELQSHPPHVSREELNESVAFLEWLSENHFTFLGSRDYAFDDSGGGKLEPIGETGLGVLSDPETRVIRRGEDRSTLTPPVRAFLTQPAPLIVAKANERARIHRRVHMDYIGVKTFDAKGKLTGERRFVGLFTSGAYSRRPSDIPLLRLKVRHVRERAGLAPDSHDGKALAHILDTYPRDDLFQLSDNEILSIALGILRLGERPKVRVFLRFDRFDRFVSALVYVPRDRYDTRVREKIHAMLAEAFNGRMTQATPLLDDSILARVHYIVGRNDGPRPVVDPHKLEGEIRDAIRTWEDGFADALIAAHGESEGVRLFQHHAAAFPPRYRDAFAPDEAVRDLDELEGLRTSGREPAIEARAYRTARDAHSALRLKLYILGSVLPLSASLPVFENLGLRVIAEDSYPVSLEAGVGWRGDAAVLDFLMERSDGGAAILADIRDRLQDAFHAIMRGAAESDGFNRLVIASGLSWRDVSILRMAAKYLRQAGFAFSQDYVEQALARNPDLAALLVELFYALHNPAGNDTREADAQKLRARIEAALNDVPSLDDDRIIRRLLNVIDCVLRTNFWQDGGKPYIAVKLDSAKLDDLPAPHPLVEIFVYSPEVEGVHLRFGRVARGGIRWSDRREDFRTEILGLVKAQQVKNAVIVPVGAKGGFYPKQLPVNTTREAVQEAGIAAYKTFIHALLDLTDDIDHNGKIIPPDDVIRRDDDDPYLVVAADKGTARFSDIANAIAMERGFWLGDAFASGGSHGYDHKKMGITARGAWEAVKRHFREMGRDVQNEPFTAIGVGDMSGDVFGNGMLLSKQTRLIAAFDHRHVFIDPDPDAVKSWTERKRLFDLPRSSWGDYDKSLISKGGGVFARTLKEIKLTNEMKSLTGLPKDKVSPAELIKALLKSETDLLWFGGIGTYIKAKSQSHADAGDRTNDAVRVNGCEVRAKVIGEGANLGATQLGRVEYALSGGRINTDAIDNSAGVDTSDHEVNLKILFSGPLRRGEITEDARDKMLEKMTEDVAHHVLQDNYDQPLALSVAQSRGLKDLDAHGRFIRDLERRGKLDRAVEFLPDDETLRQRALSNDALTRPELAVLLAYAKLDLASEILAGNLPDDPHFAAELESYFPAQAARKFRHEMENHRLRREIITDVLVNRVVNLAGPVFVHRMKEMSGAPAASVTRAFVLADGAFGLSALKARIDALDLKIPADVQTGMYAGIGELLRRLGLWFLINIPADLGLGDTIARHRESVDALRGTFASLVSPYDAEATEARIAEFEQAGAPKDVAEDVAVLPLMGAAPEVAKLAHDSGLDIDLVAGAYFAVGTVVGLDRLRGLGNRIVASEHWDRLAIRRITDDLFAGQRALAGKVLAAFAANGTRADGSEAVKQWAAAHAEPLSRTREFLAELERSGDLSIAKLTLACSQIHELAAQ